MRTLATTHAHTGGLFIPDDFSDKQLEEAHILVFVEWSPRMPRVDAHGRMSSGMLACMHVSGRTGGHARVHE